MEFGDIWNKADDNKFNKVIAKKPEKCIVADNEKKRNIENFPNSAIDNNNLLPNQLIL